MDYSLIGAKALPEDRLDEVVSIMKSGELSNEQIKDGLKNPDMVSKLVNKLSF